MTDSSEDGLGSLKKLSPDGRSRWTGTQWDSPLHEVGRASAFLTNLSRMLGSLRVFHGAVVFVPGPGALGRAANSALNVDPIARPVVHTERRVATVLARFAVPSMNTGLVLVDREALGEGTAVVAVGGWDRRNLLRALGAAGFAPDVHRTAFSNGSNIGSRSELRRFQASN